jgi:hypothetical protein
MDTKHLIDAIVRQTTILIGQLSTAAGIRAPLARVADQVFLDLARELEAQGVTRKVAADMFGMALRSYQKKIQRLSGSATDRERTLWSAVVEHLRVHGGASRQALLKHFEREDPFDLAAVLKDLVSSGLVSSTGRGTATYYELASESARVRMAGEAEIDAVTNLVWLVIYDRQPVARDALLADLPFDAELSARAVATLIEDGRVESGGQDGAALLSCSELRIPVGAEQGWEAAVFDHFRAMAAAIAAKLRVSGGRSHRADMIGGSTLSFDIDPGHLYEAQVYGLLQRVRADVHELWERVTEYNRTRAIDLDRRIEVTFYFGQSVIGDELAAAVEKNHEE